MKCLTINNSKLLLKKVDLFKRYNSVILLNFFTCIFYHSKRRVYFMGSFTPNSVNEIKYVHRLNAILMSKITEIINPERNTENSYSWIQKSSQCF